MQMIIAPLRPGDKNDAVANLQDALRLLIERELIKIDPVDRTNLVEMLAKERQDQIYAVTTRRLVILFRVQYGLNDLDWVDDVTAAALNKLLGELGILDDSRPFMVHGKITFKNGQPASAYLVRIFDVDLRNKELLGEINTDTNGSYELRYGPDQFIRAEKDNADLQVFAYHSSGRELVKSDIQFNAPADWVVDLQLPSDERGLSEYELYLSEIEPLLEDVPFTDLKEDDVHQDITFLTGETGVQIERLKMLVRSFVETKQPFDVSATKSTIPSTAFYGWYRQGLPMERSELLQRSVDSLITALKTSIDNNIVPAELSKQLKMIRSILSDAKAVSILKPAPKNTGASLGDLLGLLEPNEVLSPIQASKFALLQAETVSAKELWTKAAKILTPAQVTGVQSVLALNHIAQGNPAIIQGAKARLNDVSVSHVASPLLRVAALEVDDWRAVIKAAKIPYKNSAELTSKARELTRRVARLMPTDFLMTRAARLPDPKLLTANLKRLAKLQKVNEPNVIGKPLNNLKIKDIPRIQRKNVRAAFLNLQKTVNYYPGLQLKELLNKGGDLTRTANEIERRIAAIGKVYNNNSETNFLALDYLPESDDVKSIDFEGVSTKNQKLVLQTLKAYQRIYGVAGDALNAKDILEAGFDSAASIDNVTFSEFVEAVGLEAKEAHPVYLGAKDRVVDSGLHYMAIHDYLKTLGGDIKSPISTINNVMENKNYLMKLDGYEEMFGRQTFCNCTKCQSVLSPAAYFVDLMHFIDMNVTRNVFVGGKENHSLKLKNRRDDLWTLELSCENTNNVIPSLEIINEIMENSIAKGLSPKPPDDDRAEIQKRTYKELAKTKDSFQQPFNLPLRRVETYLKHFERTRADVAFAMGADDGSYARARSGLSEIEHSLIVRTKSNAELTHLYGDEIAKSLTYTKKIDIQAFMKLTHWTRDELGKLFSTKFVSQGKNIDIKSEKSDVDSVQNDIENIWGLDYEVLDRLHRFTRLWRKLPWGIIDLDRVLFHLRSGDTPELDTPQVKSVASLLDIQKRLAISVEELCVLIDNFPDQSFGGELSLFDRLFNREPFVTQDGRWFTKAPAGSSNPEFTHPSLGDGTSIPDNRTLQRLLAGLQISDENFVQLIEDLGLVPTSPKRFKLTNKNLSLLYRHALIMRLLKVSARQLAQLMKLGKIGATAPFRVTDLSELQSLLNFFDQLQKSPFTLDDLGFITDDTVLHPENYPDVVTISTNTVSAVQTERALEFDDTFLTQLQRVSESQSVDFINANLPSAFELVPGTLNRWRLKGGFDPMNGALIIPANISVDISLVRSLLSSFLAPGSANEFGAAVLTLLPPFTESQSRDFVSGSTGNSSANSTLASPAFEKVPDSQKWRLSRDFKPASGKLVVPPGLTIDLARVRELLYKFHSRGILPGRIAAQLNITEQKIMALSQLAGVDLKAHNPALMTELQPDGSPQILTELIQKLLPFVVLFRDSIWDESEIDYVNANQGKFSPDPKFLSTQTAFNLAAYARLISVSEPDFTPEKLPSDPAAARSIVKDGLVIDPALSNVQKEQKLETIARAFRVPKSSISALIHHLALPSEIFEAIATMSRALAFADYLGVSGETLKKIVPAIVPTISSTIPAPSDAQIEAEYDSLLNAAEGLFGTIRTKYPDEKTFAEKIEGFEDAIRSIKRDGLVEYFIRSADRGFTSTSDLYQYFLIDTQLEGCARTSRIVAANSSLQLYVHRILMNLEQDTLSDNDPDHVQVDSGLIPPDWTWRKNYRVWEANRKVFLYPENYIEPELRDDKTPLFKELESELLQQEINEENVTNAYAKYLTGYEEVATLKIVGAFHDIRSVDSQRTEDTLHLIGVTNDDPPSHYYRKIDNIHSMEHNPEPKLGVYYSPWQKIQVQIPVKYASPVIFNGKLYLFWVEIVTTSKTKLENGASNLTGYQHRFLLKACYLKPDSSWSAPQKLVFINEGSSQDAVDDPLETVDKATGNSNVILRYRVPKYSSVRDVTHWEPIDGYTVQGPEWDRIYPVVRKSQGTASLLITGMNGLLNGFVDLYQRRLPFISDANMKSYVPSALLRWIFRILNNSLDAYQLLENKWTGNHLYWSTRYLLRGDTPIGAGPLQLANIINPSDALIINRSVEVNADLTKAEKIAVDAILEFDSDIVLIQNLPFAGTSTTYKLKRLGTTIHSQLTEILFVKGLAGLLNTQYQEDLKESGLPLALANYSPLVLPEDPEEVDFSGPYGTYFREIFSHIPFIIANYLNSQQRFSSSQHWYHYMFNPTAIDDDPDKRVWRYREFRDQAKIIIQAGAFRKAITDPNALEAYRRDPFNPHAIARLRPGAYQKSIVMKYIDNLFAEFTMESINEATMLYIMAADILGPRPPDVGDCGEGDIEPKDYKTISKNPKFTDSSQFLIELEHIGNSNASGVDKADKFGEPLQFELGNGATDVQPGSLLEPIWNPGIKQLDRLSNPLNWNKTTQSSWKSFGGSELRQVKAFGDGIFKSGLEPTLDEARNPDLINQFSSSPEPVILSGIESVGDADGSKPGDIALVEYAPFVLGYIIPIEVSKASLLFCIPENKELLGYWDRVEDKLFKIRNCMDISGARRQLSLFAPEIDPRLLVRARAAGLSLEDVLNITSGSLPPYRFTFMIEKAKQYASTVQSFGSALLSALEKKDAEELNRLRATHEQNLLKLRRNMQEWEIQAAQDTQLSLERQRDVIRFRKDYYNDLSNTGLIPWERTQQVSRHIASGLHATEAILGILAGVFHILPDIGSPFAMKYGGSQTGQSVHKFAVAIRALADLSEAVSASAGLEATFQRRDDEWKHQKNLADKELANIEKQITAAQIRVEITTKSLEVHDKTIEQAEEVYEFYRDKFSSLGRYTWLSTQLHRLYRDAFNSAFAVARMVEQAYRFERQDDAATLLSNSYWDASQSGLLAGEQLLLDLQALERRYLETNYRTLEIEQSFSLRQFDPSALINLRDSGKCEFEIPEIFFNLTYPGHYRRRIKAVRLTIPCVVGPYTNVGAMLQLQQSWLRREPKLNDSALIEVPLRHTTTIAASTAQNDAGVFEFSFRDERYMPFEGAGAISKWQLTLPKDFRSFDYQTISDVILRISYTADEDGVLHGEVEELNSKLEGSIRDYLSTIGIPQTISLKHDFPSEWYKLVQSPVGSMVEFEFTKQHLPFFLSDKDLQNSDLEVVLRTELASPTMKMEFNSTKLGPWPKTSGKPDPIAWTDGVASITNMTLLGKHKIAINSGGNLANADATKAIDTSKLVDILFKLNIKTVPGK